MTCLPATVDRPLIDELKAAIAVDDRFEYATSSISTGADEPAPTAVEYLVRTNMEPRCVDRADKIRMLLDVETIPQHLWPAAAPLAAWIAAHRELFDGKTVLELGSGVGLAGLTAALFARLVVLSDCSPISLAMLELSAEKFSGRKIKSTSSAIGGGAVRVEYLKWGDQDAVAQLLTRHGLRAFDVVIGCDIFYFSTSLAMGLQTARAALGSSGGSFVCASLARSERMDVDIDTVPIERGGFRGGRIDTIRDADPDDNGLRVYQWFPAA